MIEKVFFKIMDNIGSYEKNPHLAVAVSGGCDSLCLAILAKEWTNKRGGKITALIVDHGLRKNSKKECKETQNILKKRKIFSHCFKWKFSKLPKSGVQEKAREFRYNIFEDWCFKKNIKHLLVAHHFEDQKETFFMRLNDNSNIYGLACMTKILLKKKIRILRPFLDFKKKEIIKYLKEKKINWIEDPTNISSKYFRNRLRKILPKLEKKGLTDNKLKKILKRAQKERKKIDKKTNIWLIKNVEINTLGYALINFDRLKLLNKEDFIFIFSRILNVISGLFYVPKSKYVYNFYKKIKFDENIKHINLGGCHIFLFKKKLYICREIFKKNRKQKINFQFNKIICDNRFEIEQKKNKNFFLKKKLGKSVFIEQLQKKGWNKILLKNEKLKKKFIIPNKIILSLPAIKNKKNDVLYVPHLKYYSNVKSKKEFSDMNFLFKPDIPLSNIY